MTKKTPTPSARYALAYERGATINEVADQFGVSYHYARNRLLELGVTLRTAGVTIPELPDGMADDYTVNEMTIREVAAKYGYTPGRTRRMFLEAGVALRVRGGCRKSVDPTTGKSAPLAMPGPKFNDKEALRVFANDLNALLRDFGFTTQRSVARHFEDLFSESTVHNTMSGRSRPNWDDFATMLEILGVNPLLWRERWEKCRPGFLQHQTDQDQREVPHMPPSNNEPEPDFIAAYRDGATLAEIYESYGGRSTWPDLSALAQEVCKWGITNGDQR